MLKNGESVMVVQAQETLVSLRLRVDRFISCGRDGLAACLPPKIKYWNECKRKAEEIRKLTDGFTQSHEDISTEEFAEDQRIKEKYHRCPVR
jgi:hypothetical protein